ALLDGRATLEGAHARHALDVLRVAPGQDIRVGVIDGAIGTGRVTRVETDRVELHCTLGEVPPEPDVDLLLALPRPKVMRRLWAQLAALGVGRIIVTNAARVERNYFDTHVLDPGFYRPLLIEGLQQAQDTRLPRVSVHRRFRPLVEDDLDELSSADLRLVAHPSTTATAIGGAWPPAAARVLLAVGPEGGWDDFELRLLSERGFRLVSLGSRTLRADTACVALLAALRACRWRPMSSSA
ncbi:MAG TPA: RsmE family RNA methyltransferase, partial [Vicinamibacterales bacterium]|nr:RsmE family RNA methyltransferase [Vicinamibacterales bacterium]